MISVSMRVVISAIIGTIARFVLYYNGCGLIMQKRVEVSTPTNSWSSLREGVTLMRKGISPYQGDTVHETPLALLFAYQVIKHSTPLVIFGYFVLVDLLTAFMLGRAVEKFKTSYLMESQIGSKFTKSHCGADITIKPDDPYGDSVFMAYYLNPFIIASCLGQTTTVLVNFFLAAAIFGMARGNFWQTVLALTIATYQAFYPVVLLSPACVCLHDKYFAKTDRSGKLKFLQFLYLIILLIVGTALVFVLLLSVSSRQFGWVFLDRTYGFILNVRDLKPNIGLFWYFFTEMFEHFYLLFICTFQINAFIYVLPLTTRFYDEPPLLIYSLCSLMTVFKSYPCVGDVGFYLSFLPMWKHIFPFMQQKFLVGCFFIATTVLAPIQWYLWIYSGSANANFYFGVTIAFGTAQIFLLTDILLAHLKRIYFLEHGVQRTIKGKPAGLSLT
jgi:phosphatidylinositol glycan class U